MKKSVFRITAFILLFIFLTGFLPAGVLTVRAEGRVTEIFDDVKEDGWYVDAVQYVYDKGIMVGTGSSFGVNSTLKREQFAATLYSMAGKPEIAAEAENPFSDVPDKSGYPRDGILWAVQNNVASGNGNGSFGVGKSIQRQAVASMLYKYAAMRGYDLNYDVNAIESFSDVSAVSPWAETSLKWAVTHGLVSGKGGNRLDPLGTATRAECAVMIYNLLTKNEGGEPSGYNVGDIITFGKYEQNNNFLEKEDIEWQILAVGEDRLFVVSRFALDCKKYNETDTEVTWETCSLRSWLNGDFMDEAFSDEEKAKIPLVTVSNKDNTLYNTEGGNDTEDYVFCLSLEETENFFGDYNHYDQQNHNGLKQSLLCLPTAYAVQKGAATQEIKQGQYNAYLKDYGYTADVVGLRTSTWWLRSPGWGNKNAGVVTNLGNAGAGNSYFVTSQDKGVRPAMYILTETN